MRKIPLITAVLWIASVVGYQFLPGLFRHEYFQYPLVILLSILFPVSFWLLANREKKYLSLLFIGMFLFNVSFLLFALKTNYAVQQELSTKVKEGLNPKLAELLDKGDNGKQREMIARIIYLNHGISLPYKEDDKRYILFSPTKTDHSNYLKKRVDRAEVSMQNRELSFGLVTTSFLVAVHITLFFILLVFLILYDKKKQVSETEI